MTTEQITSIARRYGLMVGTVHPMQTGYRNQSYPLTVASGKRLNLIVYKPEPHIVRRIQNAHYVANHLAAYGFAARVPIDSRITRVEGRQTVTYAGLYNYLPGTTIPWEAYTMEHIKALGGCFASMHAALARLSRSKLPCITDELVDIHNRMTLYLSRPDVQLAAEQKLGTRLSCRRPDFTSLFRQLAAQPGGQPLHMDFVRGNILFSADGVISGIIDFEKAAWGLPVIDVARTLAFLLVDCKHKSNQQVRKYFLLSGYHKRGGGQVFQAKVLESLVGFFLLYDFYKFLLHNPYESLASNEHYIRTRDQLLRRRLISLGWAKSHPGSGVNRQPLSR